MNLLSDKDLDRLSRDAVEQYDVEQNTSGWDKLEQKLNKHLPEIGKRGRRRFLFFIWLFALLSGGGLLWMLTGDDYTRRSIRTATIKSETSSQNTNQADQTVAGRSLDDNLKPKKDDQEEIQSVKPKTEIEENKYIDISKKRIEQKDMQVSSGKSNLGQNKSRSTIAHSEMTAPRTDKMAAVPDSKTSLINKLKNKSEEQSIIPISENNQPKESAVTASSVPPGAKKLSADSSKHPLADVLKTDTASLEVAKKISPSNNKSAFKKGLEIGVVLAPDMSSVKFTNRDKLGFNYGLQLGYRFTERWSINTGVLYTRKNYTSPGKDFHPPKGTWFDNIMLDKVKGNCVMFDIPINVRYDLNVNGNHRYFLTTGLSTYLMKKENYHYYYSYTNGTPGYRARSYPSDEKHWLSVLNISAGFEKKLNSKFSMQAEPYLKIPLQGVGYGNIQLNSFGMYFSLKYKPALRAINK